MDIANTFKTGSRIWVDFLKRKIIIPINFKGVMGLLTIYLFFSLNIYSVYTLAYKKHDVTLSASDDKAFKSQQSQAGPTISNPTPNSLAG